MAWAPVGSLYSEGTSPATTLAVTPTTLGNILICSYLINQTTDTTISGGGVTTWHNIGYTVLTDAGPAYSISQWYGVITATGSQTITVGVNALNLNAHEFSFSGASGFSIDTIGTATHGTVATGSYPSLTPATNELYFGTMGVGSGATNGTTTGFTFANDNNTGTVFCWSSANAPNPSSPTNTAVSGSWDALGATILAITSAAPSVDSQAAFSGGATVEYLTAEVNPNSADTTVQFQYGLTTGYGTTVPATAIDIGSGSTDAPVETTVTGLTAATTYHWRTVATNTDGTTNGADQTFTTEAAPLPSGILGQQSLGTLGLGWQGQAAPAVTAPAGSANVTVAANGPTPQVTIVAGSANVTVTAYNPGAGTGTFAPAGLANVVVAGGGPTPQVTIGAGVAGATAAASNAGVTIAGPQVLGPPPVSQEFVLAQFGFVYTSPPTSPVTTATPITAPATAQAYGPTIQIGAAAGVAGVTVAANQPTAQVAVPAGSANVTVAALAPTAGTGTVADPTVANVAVAAHAPTVEGDAAPTAGIANVTVATHQPTVEGDAAPTAGVANVAVAALNPTPQVTVLATPTSPLPGYSLWFDASQITGQTDGSSLAAWPDLSGNTHNLTATGTAQPTYYSSTAGKTVNGKPAVWFNGSTNWMASSAFTALTQPSTLFIVAASSVTTPNHTVFAGIDNTNNEGIAIGSSGQFIGFSGGSFINGPMPDTNVHVFTAVYNGASGVIQVDSAATSGGIGTEGLGGVHLGSNQNAGFALWQGPICEVVYYNSLLDAADMLAVQQYLAQKWGPTAVAAANVTVTANQPTASPGVPAGSANVTVAALAPTPQVGAGGSANVAVAAYQPVVATVRSVGSADVTVAALTPAPQPGSAAGSADVTVTAYGPIPQITALPTVANVVVAAYEPAAGTGTQAPAGSSNVTAASYGPGVTVTALPSVANVTATAYEPAVGGAITALPTVADVTVAAESPTVVLLTSPTAGPANVTVAAYGTVQAVTPGAADVVVAAYGPGEAVTAAAAGADVTVTAYQPAVGGAITAAPSVANVAVAALAAGPQVSPVVGFANVAVAAYGPVLALTAGGAVANVPVAAYGPTPDDVATLTVAAVTVTANGPAAHITVTVGVATATGTAYGVGISVTFTAGVAIVTVTAAIIQFGRPTLIVQTQRRIFTVMAQERTMTVETQAL